MEVRMMHFSGQVLLVDQDLRDSFWLMNMGGKKDDFLNYLPILIYTICKNQLNENLLKYHNVILFLYYRYRTDVLKRYLGKELKLTLPDNKKLTDINWLAIYDLSKNVRSFLSYYKKNKYFINIIKLKYTYIYFRSRLVMFTSQKILNHQLNK